LKWTWGNSGYSWRKKRKNYRGNRKKGLRRLLTEHDVGSHTERRWPRRVVEERLYQQPGQKPKTKRETRKKVGMGGRGGFGSTLFEQGKKKRDTNSHDELSPDDNWILVTLKVTRRQKQKKN